MTPAQRGVLDRYFSDLDVVRNCYQLYTAEDKIRGALIFLLDTQVITSTEYNEWDRKLLAKVDMLEEKNGF